MRTPAQRGPIGNWLRQERSARGWRNQEVARKNLRAAGINVAESVYAEWESGTRIPSEANLAALERYFGSSPKAEAGERDGPVSAELLAALTRYADLVDRLVRQNAALMADRGIILRDGSVPAEDLAEIEAAEQAGIGSTSPRRTPARERSAERRSTVRSAG